MLVYGQTFWQYPIHFLPFFILFVILIKSKNFCFKETRKRKAKCDQIHRRGKKRKIDQMVAGKERAKRKIRERVARVK